MDELAARRTRSSAKADLTVLRRVISPYSESSKQVGLDITPLVATMAGTNQNVALALVSMTQATEELATLNLAYWILTKVEEAKPDAKVAIVGHEVPMLLKDHYPHISHESESVRQDLLVLDVDEAMMLLDLARTSIEQPSTFASQVSNIIAEPPKTKPKSEFLAEVIPFARPNRFMRPSRSLRLR